MVKRLTKADKIHRAKVHQARERKTMRRRRVLQARKIDEATVLTQS